MAKKIHPQALVSSSAVIGNNVEIGPFAVINDNVNIGDGTVIDAFAFINGHTEIGKNNHIFSYASIGNQPQDLKYKGEKTYLVIGDNNIIREFVTMNPGTERDSKTNVGSNNLIMAYCHIAHDCFVGNENIFANNATLAGHVEVGNKIVIGGLSAIHQFCRVGNNAIIGGCSKVVQDVPPYSMSDGHPAVVYGLNAVGLRRANISNAVISELKKAFKILFFEDHPFDKAKELVKKTLPELPEINYLIKFMSSSKRGVGR
jgi:UDP-N-acetylglucosamine acyltransferase